ncbi:MAG: dihydroorotate dehydrogenase, partial [Phycisphaerae bacterium]|nr:dihydroorotate dehydrogenase [Phycisphaerae bacterium]
MKPTLLPVTLAGVPLRNPIIAAAGTCGYVTELADVLAPAALGAIVTKSITREPRVGNPPWRIIDARHGMLNAVGLANVGLDGFVADKLPAAAGVDTVIIGSIAGNSIDDYVAVAAAFDAADTLPLVELNVSCPNTSDGLQFGEHPAGLRALLSAVRPALGRTKMIVKLSPNVGDIVAMARAAIDGGADAITLINT